MNPNNVSSATQAAAEEAVRDQSYMIETCEMTARLRQQVTEELRASDFHVYPSHTNFVLIDLKDEKAAKAAYAKLCHGGIILRPQSGAGLPAALRMTIAEHVHMEKAVSALRQWQKEYVG